VIKILAKAMRKEKEIKVVQIEKEQIRLFLFADVMILYLKGPKGSIGKFKYNK
jgi:hypothetical protein